MNNYEALVNHARGAGVLVVPEGNITVSMRSGDLCAIFINEARYERPDELEEALAHELGHCETAAFYQQDSPGAAVLRCEYSADCWAAFTLLPPWRLSEIVEGGARDIREIAEEAGRTVSFVRRTLSIYRAKGLLGSCA